MAGIVVPEVLRAYMPAQYKEIIKFVKKAPIDQEREKAAAAGKVCESIGAHVLFGSFTCMLASVQGNKK